MNAEVRRTMSETGDTSESAMIDLRDRDVEPDEDARPVPDPYAASELLRRHERTESMIRRAREQFS